MIARVVLVTDPRYDLTQTCSALRDAATALGGQRVIVQLRDKEASEAALLATAQALRAATTEVGAQLVINGPLAIALAIAREAGADGIHVPGRRSADAMTSACAAAREVLGQAAIVTVAAHDDDDVRNALLAGASAVLVSPIFETPGKGPARGLDALRSARAIVDAARHETSRHGASLSVVALGGITAANAATCIEAGADGVAAIRALHEGSELVRALVAGCRDEC